MFKPAKILLAAINRLNAAKPSKQKQLKQQKLK